MLEKIIEKVFSGRFILTIIGGLVFAYCAVTKILATDVVATIVTAIILSYFQRTDRNGKPDKLDKTPNS